MPGRAGCGHGAAGTRPALRHGTPCSGAACPPTPNLPHQTVTSFPGPEPEQPGREGNVPEIDATWCPEAVSQGPGWDGNQLLCAVSRKILFMIDGAEMKPLSWLHGPSPSMHAFCYCPPFSILFLFPTSQSLPPPPSAPAVLAVLACTSHDTQQACGSKVQTSALLGPVAQALEMVSQAIPLSSSY